jgi:hypothetical protein
MQKHKDNDNISVKIQVLKLGPKIHVGKSK